MTVTFSQSCSAAYAHMDKASGTSLQDGKSRSFCIYYTLGADKDDVEGFNGSMVLLWTLEGHHCPLG